MKRCCIERNCAVLIVGRTRCPAHERARQRRRDALRGSPAERGYNREYFALRHALLVGGPPCYWGCGRLATTADHLQPLSRGGQNIAENLVPSCKPCNYSRGGRMARR